MKSNVVIELKVVSKWGLYSGKRKKLDKKIDYDSLKVLDNELITKSENDLLKMDYCYFCSEKNNYNTNDALKQINGYTGLLKDGSVSDSKVKAVNTPDCISILGEWVIMSLGSNRILLKKIPFNKINYEFAFINL